MSVERAYGRDDTAMFAEERMFEACERLLRSRGIRANRASVNLTEYGGIVRRLCAKVTESGESAYVLLHGPTGSLRVTYDLSLEDGRLFVYREQALDPLPDEQIIHAALADLTAEQLQVRYESEEGAAMIAMARAQRTLAEIARRKDAAS